jgi:hypothetical protein
MYAHTVSGDRLPAMVASGFTECGRYNWKLILVDNANEHMYYSQHERSCCIGYTRREFVSGVTPLGAAANFFPVDSRTPHSDSRTHHWSTSRPPRVIDESLRNPLVHHISITPRCSSSTTCRKMNDLLRDAIVNLQTCFSGSENPH